MSAISNAVDSSTVPPARGRKRANLVQAEKTADKINCYIYSAKLVDGKFQVQYAVGEALIVGYLAGVDFKVLENPTQEIKRLMDLSSKTMNECPAGQCSIGWSSNSTDDRVTTLIANVHVPYSPGMAHILAGIGACCQGMFPHLKPELSALNVHHEFTHLRCDSILLSQEGESHVSLNPK